MRKYTTFLGDCFYVLVESNRSSDGGPTDELLSEARLRLPRDAWCRPAFSEITPGGPSVLVDNNVLKQAEIELHRFCRMSVVSSSCYLRLLRPAVPQSAATRVGSSAHWSDGGTVRTRSGENYASRFSEETSVARSTSHNAESAKKLQHVKEPTRTCSRLPQFGPGPPPCINQ